MRILQVFHHYKPYRGGVERVIEQLNKNLNAKGFECSVLCLDRNPGSSERLPARQRFDEALVERIPFLDMRYYKLAPFNLKRLQGFDIVHVHGLGFFADYLAMTKPLHKKPLVLSTHGGIFHTKGISFIKNVYFSLWNRLAIKAFSKVIAVSRNDLELFKRIAPEKKLALIENPVNVEELAKLKSRPEENNFLFVGRLSKNKGLSQLLEAFALVKKQQPVFTVRIVGKEFDISIAELEKEISRLGLEENVKLRGEVSDKQLLQDYAISGVFVSASNYEGFGISAVEAMAAGLIPVLNDIQAFKGFVKSGENGFIVDFSDSRKAAKEILRVMKLGKSERKRLGRNAQRFASGFGWKEKIKDYIAEYESALEADGKR